MTFAIAFSKAILPSRFQREPVVCHINQFNAPGIGNNQARTIANRMIDLKRNDGMSLGRIGAKDKQQIGSGDLVERLACCPCSE